MHKTFVTPDFLIVGGGIFGLTAAIELRKRKYNVTLINDDAIPSSGAASNDISKVVRMEYGTDTMYMDFADHSIDGWRQWNMDFSKPLYHETGFLLLSKVSMDDEPNGFEASSFSNLIARGYTPQRLDEKDIAEQFPVFARGPFIDGFLHSKAGFANAALTVVTLKNYASSLGINIIEKEKVIAITNGHGGSVSVESLSGLKINAGHCILTAGAATPFIESGYEKVMIATGHPVFHIVSENPDKAAITEFPVFAADISRTGWYGFPPHPDSGVIKIANHGAGEKLNPYLDQRLVSDSERQRFKDFVVGNMPGLLPYRIVYERKCLYSDTFDGHFWIDNSSHQDNLTIAAGGSGHAFKMAPLLGSWIADVAEGNREKCPSRFHRREPGIQAGNVEEARFKA